MNPYISAPKNLLYFSLLILFTSKYLVRRFQNNYTTHLSANQIAQLFTKRCTREYMISNYPVLFLLLIFRQSP